MTRQAGGSTSCEIDAPQAEAANCAFPSCPALSQLAERTLLVPCEPAQSHWQPMETAPEKLYQRILVSVEPFNPGSIASVAKIPGGKYVTVAQWRQPIN